ncbi:MAG: YhjD/YihY/BrkB family envelope integrity protein [Dehalococcoidia bacterium]
MPRPLQLRDAGGRFAGELRALIRGVTKQSLEDDVAALSAEAAYHSLLAFFPFLLFVAASLGYLSGIIDTDGAVDAIVGQVEGTAPDDASSTLEDLLNDLIDDRRPELLIFGALFAIWSGSNAVRTLIKGINRIQGVKDPTKAVGRRVLAFAFLALFFAVLLATQLVVHGSTI